MFLKNVKISKLFVEPKYSETVNILKSWTYLKHSKKFVSSSSVLQTSEFSYVNNILKRNVMIDIFTNWIMNATTSDILPEKTTSELGMVHSE